MREILTVILLIIGAAFIFISALGIVRMPDLYLRMSASTKTGTLGVGSILLAAAVYFFELGIASRSVATIIFILLTAPVAAHMMGRAAYFNGVPLWKETRYDELKGHYNLKTHTLNGDSNTSALDSNAEEVEQSSPS